MAKSASALYINPLSLPGRCVHNPNEVIFLAHMPLSVLGRRANFVLAFPRCIMRLQNFPDCPQCIHDLSGCVKRGWVVVVESFTLYTLHCKERVGGRGCRKLFASCGSAHQTSIQALQPPLASISTSHQSWWWTNLPTPFIPSL